MNRHFFCWGYGLAPFHLAKSIAPFPVRDMGWPVQVGDMDLGLSGPGYGLAHFRLGIWTGPFPVGAMDRPLFVATWMGPSPIGDTD